MSRDDFNDKLAAMQWQRQKQDVEMKKNFRRPINAPRRILFLIAPSAKETNDAVSLVAAIRLRRAQIDYYLSVLATSDEFRTCFVTSAEAAIAAAERCAPIDDFFLLSHGDDRGNVAFSEGHVLFRDLVDKIHVRGDAFGFITINKLHCYNHREHEDINDSESVEYCLGDCISNFSMWCVGYVDYQFRRTIVSTTEEKGELVTYNIPRVFVDGLSGFVHTGLNPEVRVPVDKDWISHDFWDILEAKICVVEAQTWGFFSDESNRKLVRDHAMLLAQRKPIPQQVVKPPKKKNEDCVIL